MTGTPTGPGGGDPLWGRTSALASELPLILLVDDDPTSLEIMERQLCRDHRVITADSGAAALRHLDGCGPVSVVVCDLWMPGMDGIATLGAVRERCPDTTRILHTAHADLRTAVAAINTGQVYRFLIKPCPGEELRTTVRDAIERYRVRLAQRQILDTTVRASIQALFDCLELANPAVFARAGRIRSLVGAVCHAMGMRAAWEIEVAAMASQLGAVTLPPEVLLRLDRGDQLPDEEQAMVDAMPAVGERLLGRVPHLEPVVAILRALAAPSPAVPVPAAAAGAVQSSPLVATGVEVIRAAGAFDALHSRGVAPWSAVAALETAGGWGDDVLSALRQIHGLSVHRDKVVQVPARELRPGMRIVEDLRSDQGVVLIGQGTVVTEVMLDRLGNYLRAGAHTAPVLAALPTDERARIRARLSELIDAGGSADVAFVQHLVITFLSRARDILEELRAASHARDGSAIEHRAHALRGSAANVGAARIADICEVIELLVAEGRLDRVTDQVERLEVAMGQAPREFAEVLEELAPGFRAESRGEVAAR